MSGRSSIEETLPPACQEDPYEFEEWLAGRSEPERSAVALGVLSSLGHKSMQRWKEHHAFSIGIGRPLDEFPAGVYSFYFMPIESDPPEDALPEDLEPPDLEVLGEAAGLDADEMAEMDDEELSEYIEDNLGAEFLGEDGDGYYKLAEAPSLHDLLRLMAERGLLGIDPDPWLTDDQPWPKGAGADAPWSAIRDRHLRRIARGLSGDGWHMFRTDDEEEADEADLERCQRSLLRRPDCEFILGWFALPPAEIGNACILCRVSTDEAESDVAKA